MVRDELSVLAAFLTVAKEKSFTRAARRLGVSPSALTIQTRPALTAPPRFRPLPLITS